MVLSTGSTTEENRERLLDCGPELVLLDIAHLRKIGSYLSITYQKLYLSLASITTS